MRRKIRRDIQRKVLNSTLAATLVASMVPFSFNPIQTKAEGTTTAESAVTLRLLETTDLHANVMDYDYYKDASTIEFGLARTAQLIKEARTEQPNSMLFDAGDLIQGNPLADYVAKVKGLKDGEVHPVIGAMNHLKYDAGILGNHEFNYGLDFLEEAKDDAQFPIVNANVYIDDKDSDPTNDVNKFKPYDIIDKKVIDKDGREQTIKVGVIGFAPPQIMNWDKDNLTGKVIAKDIVETANKFIPEMRTKGADVIVAIAHSGCDINAEGQKDAENAVYSLAQVEGIDALLFGHAHVNFPGDASFNNKEGIDNVDGHIHDVPAVEAGYWGNNLGVMDLELEKVDGKWVVASSKAANRPIFKTVDGKKVSQVSGPDQEIVDLVKDAHDGTLSYVRGKIGETTAPMFSYFARVQDDPTIQIVNNAQKAYVEKWIADKLPEYKDVTVLSAGAPFKAGRQGPSDYTNILAGDLSIKSANDLYLYPNTLKAVELTGAQVKEWLEMSAGQFNKVDPTKEDAQDIINYAFQTFNFDVIDGLKYQIDITKDARYDLNGNLVNENTSRIVNLTMADGSPLNLNEKFVVVTNNYRASGGGNFPGLKGGVAKIVVDSPDENREVLMKYIEQQGVVNPSADNNWKIAPVGGVAKLKFNSSPDAVSYANGSQNIKPLGPVTDSKGTWESYSLDQNVHVQLLGINDYHGQLDTIRTIKDKDGVVVDKSGGIEYLAAYLKQREATNPANTLMLHAGDAVGASAPVSALLQDEPTIRILNELGFDGGTLGNHEFDEGVEEMLRLIDGGTHPKTGDFEGANFPYAAANVKYKDSGALILNPYFIQEVDGVKIGVIGVVTTETPQIVIKSAVQNVEFTDEVEAINKYTQELKDQGVESIVVLAHNPGISAKDGSNATGDVVDFANEVDDEVDVIFGGHNHQYLNTVVDNKLLVQSYAYGTAFSDVDLVIDPVTKDIVQKKGEIVDTLHSKITPDAKIKAELDAYKAETAPILNAKVGETEVELTRTPNPNGEQVLGNVIADAMRAEMGTDMAFMNPGGIRNDLNAGEITWGELFSVQPFGNDLIKMTVTGEVIRELLNQQWADPTRAKMLQISGLVYTYDDTLERGSRILDIFLENGEEIDPQAEYTITVNNFMAGGGDGYQALLKGTNKVQGVTDLDGLINYVKNHDGPLNADYENRFLKADSEIVDTELFYLDEFTDVLEGTTDPYAVVTATVDGEVIGEGHADNYGYFAIDIEEQEVGTIVVVETTDLFGNTVSTEFEVGEALRGWQQFDGHWYYFNPETGEPVTGWYRVTGKWYLFDEEGIMQTGWERHGNKWYYMKANGEMAVGWIYVGNKWYFLDDQGVMKTGWVKSANKWYFLDSYGVMKTGWVQTGGKWYFLNKDGTMKTGWVQSNGKWYYLASSGAMQTGWVQVGKKWYYFYKDGSMAANTTVNGYKLGKDGAWIK